ncbi:MAG: DNA mismatch repair protein MutS [Candidatus Coatesbacteria bacterium]|nr:DNA mismatch repair protein MutS [Candidatus Coatesbacteria bacterium]
MDTKDTLTPLIKQYKSIKDQYPDSILFFRMGDFYEMFFEDAKIASVVLQIVLTTRGKDRGEDVPLAGFPYKALDEYLPKMIKAGYKVAICEQVEDPKKAKGIVKREVIDVVTAGTVTSSSLLNPAEAAYLGAVVEEADKVALAYIDITTGVFKVTENNLDNIIDEIAKISPKELLLPDSMKDRKNPWNSLFASITITLIPDYYFMFHQAEKAILDYFGLSNLDGWGIESKPMIRVIGAITTYLSANKKDALLHVEAVEVISSNDYLKIDRSTLSHLEILHSKRERDSSRSLAGILDKTDTPMGARLLREWLTFPLYSISKIKTRHDIVDFFTEDGLFLAEIKSILSKISDLERILGKLAMDKANPRQILNIATAIRSHQKILNLIGEKNITKLYEALKTVNLSNIAEDIEQTIQESPPLQVGDGTTIKEGVSEELDSYKKLTKNAQEIIAQIENRERKRTGVDRLKVKYNKVFGYYIEIPKSFKGELPEDFIRKQTTLNAERYFTAEIKEYEEKIYSADEKINEIENGLFKILNSRIRKSMHNLKHLSKIIASLDVLCSFAKCARDFTYIRPEINDSNSLEIIEGRHPVIEQLMPYESFIPNDLFINPPEIQTIILTGPNMAGKSTYLRQIALIALMAQAGSFVPAVSARIGLIDRLFTRVGASDDILSGASTFLVEMNETAYILNHSTNKSLILLDEIGRGTSTYDGLSIAWAVVEYINDTPNKKAKTIFATHYHELTILEESAKGIINYTVAVQETEDKVLFLRKVRKGYSDRSYGIHVAKMAGLPKSVIKRANTILSELEKEQKMLKSQIDTGSNDVSVQLTLFSPPSEIIAEEIKSLDLNSITPLELMQRVEFWKQELKKY